MTPTWESKSVKCRRCSWIGQPKWHPLLWGGGGLHSILIGTALLESEGIRNPPWWGSASTTWFLFPSIFRHIQLMLFCALPTRTLRGPINGWNYPSHPLMGLSQWLFLYLLSSIACPSEPPTSPFDLPRQNQRQKESCQQMLFFPEPCIGRMASTDAPRWRTPYPTQVSAWGFLGISAMCFVEFIRERDGKQWRPDDKEKTEERNPGGDSLRAPVLSLRNGELWLVQPVQSWLQRRLQHS